MRLRYALLAACVLVLAVPVAASAHPMPVSTLAQTLGNATASLTQAPDDGGADFTTTDNMRLLGFSERRVAPNDFSRFNTDLAFWGDRAFQGQFNGFRILDVDNPRRPEEILNYEQCGTVGQGDVVVWGSILVRSWDVNTSNAQTCDGQTVPIDFEGLHIFDISDVMNPELVASVNLECGSHTATGVPDLGNRRLLVYSTPSSGACDGLDIVEVPLSRPEESEFLRFEFAGRGAAGADGFACHDTGVILGRANKAACAGGLGFAVWSLGGADGGSRDNRASSTTRRSRRSARPTRPTSTTPRAIRRRSHGTARRSSSATSRAAVCRPAARGTASPSPAASSGRALRRAR